MLLLIKSFHFLLDSNLFLMNVHKQIIVIEIYMSLIDDVHEEMILLFQLFVEYHLMKNLFK